MPVLQLSSLLASLASSASEAVETVEGTQSRVGLEEFEISFEFNGEMDLDQIATLQEAIFDRDVRSRKRAFPGVRLLQYRSAEGVEAAKPSLIARLFRPTPPPPATKLSRIAVRLVLETRDT